MIDYTYQEPEQTVWTHEIKYHAVGDVIAWGYNAEIKTACGRTLKGPRVHKGASAYREIVTCERCRRTKVYKEEEK